MGEEGQVGGGAREVTLKGPVSVCPIHSRSEGAYGIAKSRNEEQQRHQTPNSRLSQTTQ